jgi:hypothetical protein
MENGRKFLSKLYAAHPPSQVVCVLRNTIGRTILKSLVLQLNVESRVESSLVQHRQRVLSRK